MSLLWVCRRNVLIKSNLQFNSQRHPAVFYCHSILLLPALANWICTQSEIRNPTNELVYQLPQLFVRGVSTKQEKSYFQQPLSGRKWGRSNLWAAADTLTTHSWTVPCWKPFWNCCSLTGHPENRNSVLSTSPCIMWARRTYSVIPITVWWENTWFHSKNFCVYNAVSMCTTTTHPRKPHTT